jgi:hypothetical protein
VLDARPMLGRVFTEDEDNHGARVAGISYGLWPRRFGGSPELVGRRISINDQPYEVIGFTGFSAASIRWWLSATNSISPPY